MKKLFFLLLPAIAILVTSFDTEKSNGFMIKGTAVGFTDSTLLYLDDITDGSFKDIDSTYIINERFIFKGTLKTKVIHTVIRTRNFSDYKYFWLEESLITFTAEKGKFRNALITGSKTQDEENQLDNEIKIKGKEKEQDILFIQNHPNSIVSANILNVYASIWGKDTATILYRNLSDEIKNSAYGKNILEFITLNKNIHVGDKYVDFSEPNIEGKNVSLSDFHGKIVLLEFWGSWCGP